MREPDSAEGYFSSGAEIEAALELPLLGRLEAEPRFYQLQDVLASLAPDPRFAERLYRFVETDPLRVWVAGLGDAGEEVPVAVGIAERAAAVSGHPVLLGRLQDPMPDQPRRSGLMPVEAPQFEELLQALFPAGCAVLPSGIQGVFRAWEGPPGGGQAIRPAGIVLSGMATNIIRRPRPEQLGGVVLVVPMREQTRANVLAAAAALRGAGYPLIGFVAFGSPASPAVAEAAAPPVEAEARATVAVGEPTEPGPERVTAPPPEAASVEAAASAPDDATLVTPQHEPLLPPEAEAIVASEEESEPPKDWVAGSPPVKAGPERVAVARSWSDAFGPRRRKVLGLRRRWWLFLVALVVIAVLVVRFRAWERLPLTGEGTTAPATESAAVVDEDSSPAVVTPALDEATEAEATPPPADALQPTVTEGPQPATGPQLPESGDVTEAEAEAEEAEHAETPSVTTSPAAAPPETAAGETAEPEATSPETTADETMEPDAAPSGESAPSEVHGPVAQAASEGDAPPQGIRDMVASYEGPFAVLCGSFRSEQRASAEAARLRSLGLDARRLSVRIPERGVWHRVIIGGGATREAAQEMAQTAVDSGWVSVAQVIAKDGAGQAVPYPIRSESR